MPIRPENVSRYPADWPAISWVIRWVRALGRCECLGECGRPHSIVAVDERFRHASWRVQCTAINGQPSPLTGAKVVLTVAHLDHTPENVHAANLRAFCQGCHLRYDATHHVETRRHGRGVYDLFEQPAPSLT